MFGRKKVEELSVEELRQALVLKRRQARMERFQELSASGLSSNESLVGPEAKQGKDVPDIWVPTSNPPRPSLDERPNRAKKVRDVLLLGLEVTAIVGLVAVLVASYFNLRELNDEVAEAQQNLLVAPAPPRVAAVPAEAPAFTHLPGGHSPPTAPGGAVPDVPLHLQQWVQPDGPLSNSAPAIEIEKQAVAGPTRIVIPKIKVDAPIIGGVGWEDLKKGVGHLPGSANPGQRGNLYLAAHNDIFGEIFRYLNDLEVGDEYYIYGGEQKFKYIVVEKRIIDPTEVEVMYPTTEPVATLQTCYPYLVDTHRLVVISELVQ